MVVTDDEELYHVMLALRAHGWTRNLPKFNHVTGENSDDPFDESFRFGFSLVIRPNTGLKRSDLTQNLFDAGFDCRPIVAGNFAKNEVMKYFDYSIH